MYWFVQELQHEKNETKKLSQGDYGSSSSSKHSYCLSKGMNF